MSMFVIITTVTSESAEVGMVMDSYTQIYQVSADNWHDQYSNYVTKFLHCLLIL